MQCHAGLVNGLAIEEGVMNVCRHGLVPLRLGAQWPTRAAAKLVKECRVMPIEARGTRCHLALQEKVRGEADCMRAAALADDLLGHPAALRGDVLSHSAATN
eukprot:6492371-Amphidinium_carterae.1